MILSTSEDKTAATHSWLVQAQVFVRWIFTPLGLFITIYGLNVIAWGGMLFLLLCNAAPAMCHPSCDSLYSSRRIWIEIDSQILNALFCVTGFGLAPWRIRDLYQWCRWRLARTPRTRQQGLNRLSEIHVKWFQLSEGQGEEDGDLPTFTTATAVRSSSAESGSRLTNPNTPLWKMDAVVLGNIMNSVLQVCLAVCMWAMNRFNRPSWTTGLFVALACLCAGCAGIIMWLEEKRICKPSEHPGALLLVPYAQAALVPETGRNSALHLNPAGSPRTVPS
ncbi:hypothetical protein N7468_006140 [Penicillium chermesinum]|uniref:Uncharacterized protein n=1 Tax=Penicillium chermesinum TaxID=63820 RepID=A0A9W9TQD1_9EURO|nr:uncharacterized protein N7468_006140 [Penicillium chermesinum]KAJ5233184.1 hypothetical protein N7468_006140 [Penicillium chermesinum]KAJ6172819.1 hypothetical protein N7470_001886 [Penicillium chermesinum]